MKLDLINNLLVFVEWRMVSNTIGFFCTGLTNHSSTPRYTNYALKVLQYHASNVIYATWCYQSRVLAFFYATWCYQSRVLAFNEWGSFCRRLPFKYCLLMRCWSFWEPCKTVSWKYALHVTIHVTCFYSFLKNYSPSVNKFEGKLSTIFIFKPCLCFVSQTLDRVYNKTFLLVTVRGTVMTFLAIPNWRQSVPLW